MAAKDDDKIPGVPEAPHSKAAGARTGAGREVDPGYGHEEKPEGDKAQRAYYVAAALSGVAANAALHRAPNAAAVAVKLADDVIAELAKPPQLSDEELTERARLKHEAQAQQRREQREAEEEAEAKVAKEREEQEAKEREKLEKAEREERDKLEKQVDKQMRERDKPGNHARPM